MKRVFATVHVNPLRKSGLKLSGYHGTAFFTNVPELTQCGRDFRTFGSRTTTKEFIEPGESIDEVEVRFLCPEDVLPYMKVGVRFWMWEGSSAGECTVTRINEDSGIEQ